MNRRPSKHLPVRLAAGCLMLLLALAASVISWMKEMKLSKEPDGSPSMPYIFLA